ncbi:hypothetical protein AALP_AA8G302800, partial [Arabis alpina]
WCTLITENSKRSKAADSTTSDMVFNVEEHTKDRPSGVKAAKMEEKKKGKGKSDEPKGSASTLKVLESMWKVKKEEMETKERLSRQKLLECLITKVEPLSEGELNLKNKLLAEMFNDQGAAEKEA